MGEQRRVPSGGEAHRGSVGAGQRQRSDIPDGLRPAGRVAAAKSPPTRTGRAVMKPICLAVALIALSSPALCAETVVERGRYLVTTIGGCGNCHSPRGGGTALEGKVIPGTELSGGLQLDEEIGQLRMPNITPDIGTGIGEWTNQ